MTNHELNPFAPEAVESFHSSRGDAGSGDERGSRHFVNIWMRRRWLIIGSIVFGVVTSVLFTVFTTPVYEATSTIELNKENNGSLDLGLGDETGSLDLNLGGGDLETDLKTEATVLQSNALAMTVIKDLDLAAQSPFVDSKHPALHVHDTVNVSPEARTHLLRVFLKHLRVETVGGTRLIQVSFRSHDPKQATNVANALIDSYMQMYLQTHYAAVSQASQWMTHQLSDLKANVENSEKQLTDFEKASGILTVPTETTLPTGETVEGSQVHSPVIEKLDALNLELTAAESDRVQKEAIYRLALTGNPEVILGLVASPISAQGSSIMPQGGEQQNLLDLEGLESKRYELQVQMAQEQAVYGPNNRHFKDLQTQLSAVNGEVQDELKKVVDRAAADLKLSQQTENGIRAQYRDEETEANKLNDKNVELTLLSEEALSQKKLYDDLYTRLQEANVSAGVKATNITITDPAFTPSVPVVPKPSLFILLGTLFGASLGFGAAHLRESFDTTVVSLPEIEEITRSAVIAVIPDFTRQSRSKKTRDNGLVHADELQADQSKTWILAHPTSIASEAFRTLRTSVFLSRPGGVPRTLLITSSVPREGKSTVAFNLAIAIAQNGRKVIVVDADLRRPSLRQFLRIDSKIGLSSVLADVASLDEAIVGGVSTENLDALPAGPVPPLPAELLSSKKFDSVLGELRSRYDVVLIDSPPALLLTDAITMAAKVDAVIWIVRAGTATRPHLVRAAQQIQRNRMAFIGYVLNALDTRIDPYGYGYSYYGYNPKRYEEYYGKDDGSST